MNLVRCRYNHPDCHMSVGNRCKLLSEPISGAECPFFKTEAEVQDDRIKAHERLKNIGRYDLIQQYEYNSNRTW